MQLLERSETLERLEISAGEAAEGRGRVVCLVGEAGIGKSSVARVLAERVGDRLRVLWGACEDLSTPAPLAPLYDFARLGNWALPQTDTPSGRVSAFNTALSELTAEPTLVVLEDLHWADDATADFVRYVARRIANTSVLLLATGRNDTADAQNRLRRALADASPQSVERIELLPLSMAAVREAAQATGHDAEAVFALTSGNPFLTMEVLRSSETVPPTARNALLWRADKLSADARRCLDAASIFPRRVEIDVLRRMTSEEGEGAIAACVAAGLLVHDGDYCAFKHEISRRAIEESVPVPERARLNGRALQILRAGYPQATARLAHHAIEAGDVDAICDLCPRAAVEASEAGAHREACNHYASALAHADRFNDERRAELFEKAGYELQLIGRLGDAIGSFESALALRRKLGDDVKAGDDLRWLGRMHYNNGNRPAASRLAEEAIEALKWAGPTYELAMAYANLALLKALEDDSAASITLANITIDLAEQLGREEIVADAHGTLGAAKRWRDPKAAREHFAKALKLSLPLHRPELVARMYTNGSSVLLNARSSEAAREWLVEGIAYCSEHDGLTWANYMQGLHAELLVRDGAWGAARELAERTLTGNLSPVGRFPASVALALLNVRTGEDAAPMFANLVFDNEPQRRMSYAPILGEYAWVTQRDVEQALSVLKEVESLAVSIGNAWGAGEIAYWRYKIEDVSPPTLDGLAAPYQLLFSGDWREAANAWRALHMPYDAALALLEGDLAACDEALTVLDALGASAIAARARKDLREKGMRGLRRGPRSSTQKNKAGLTNREMEVLLLLEQGMANADIARALSTAVKTVDHHVSAILGKLRSSSRGEAVARAREMGILQ